METENVPAFGRVEEVTPKFKVGDIVRCKSPVSGVNILCEVISIELKNYRLKPIGCESKYVYYYSTSLIDKTSTPITKLEKAMR